MDLSLLMCEDRWKTALNIQYDFLLNIQLYAVGLSQRCTAVISMINICVKLIVWLPPPSFQTRFPYSNHNYLTFSLFSMATKLVSDVTMAYFLLSSMMYCFKFIFLTCGREGNLKYLAHLFCFINLKLAKAGRYCKRKYIQFDVNKRLRNAHYLIKRYITRIVIIINGFLINLPARFLY